jgi:L-asparaginase
MGVSPRIRYVALGGTISSTAAAGAAAVPSLAGAEIVASVPGLQGLAQIETSDLATIASFMVGAEHWIALAREIASAEAAGCDGVVVTHGTDTLEETAYVLALTVRRTLPVVLTGAARNPSLAGPDGPANLLAAFRTAVSPLARELGPVVVLDDSVHAARFATKTHTTKPSTFVSPWAGPLGELAEGRLEVWWKPAWEDYLGSIESLEWPRVELVRMTADDSGAVLAATVATRPDAIVIEGTGGGHIPPAAMPALADALASGVPVAIASRCVSGATIESTYDVAGMGPDLTRRGAIHVGRLQGHKARLRLLVGLALGRDPRSLFPVR